MQAWLCLYLVSFCYLFLGVFVAGSTFFFLPRTSTDPIYLKTFVKQQPPVDEF